MSDIKLKLPIVLIGVLLLLSVVVVAETEYLNIGGTDFDFSQGNGGFNAGAVSSQKSRV